MCVLEATAKHDFKFDHIIAKWHLLVSLVNLPIAKHFHGSDFYKIDGLTKRLSSVDTFRTDDN